MTKRRGSIIFAGDVVPGGILCYERIQSPLCRGAREIFLACDYRVCTLECPIANPVEFADKPNVVYALPTGISILKKMGVDLVSVGTNHFHDLGDQGMEETLRALDNANIRHVGGGCNLAEARTPVVEKINGGIVGFLGYCASGLPDNIRRVRFAREDSPGVAPLEPDTVKQDVLKLRRTCDHVFVLVHWGVEHTWFPPPRNVDLAKKIVSFGADCVIGGHAHRVQGGFKVGKSHVYPSLGNFLFPSFIIDPPRICAYPETLVDQGKIPKTYKYRDVATRTYAAWKFLGRVGMCVCVSLHQAGTECDEIVTIQHNHTSHVSVARPPLKWALTTWLGILSRVYNARGYPVIYPYLAARHLMKLRLYEAMVRTGIYPVFVKARNGLSRLFKRWKVVR